MTGHVVRERIQGDRYLEFRYDVIRVWQLHWRDVAAAGVGALPLATLTDDAEREAAIVVSQLDAVVQSRRSSADLYALWSAVYLMLGLKYSEFEISESWEGVRIMSLSDVLQESSTFQAILRRGLEEGLARGLEEGREEGRLEALREVLLDLGTRLLGRPAKSVRTRITRTTDVDRLEELIQRLPDAESWKGLLNGA